jgi:hypothetical protein
MSDEPKVYPVANMQDFLAKLKAQADAEPLEVPPGTDTSPEKLRALHGPHVRRYRGRLDAHNAGQSGYRPEELVHLIRLWNEVEAKGFKFDELSDAAKREVLDAIFDE